MTGTVRRKTELGKEHFAEGLTMTRDGKLAQITWRSNRGFYYDPKTLEQIGEFRTPLEDGWGLAVVDAKKGSDEFIVSDASHNLHFIKGSVGGGASASGGAAIKI